MTYDTDQAIENTLQELRNLKLPTEGPVVAKDLREIIIRQMELSRALFDRQHQDVLKQIELNKSFFESQHKDVDEMHSSVKRFTASSKRVEKLTFGLIGLTGVLAVMTYFLIPIKNSTTADVNHKRKAKRGIGAPAAPNK